MIYYLPHYRSCYKSFNAGALGPSVDEYPLVKLDDCFMVRAMEQEANFLVIGHREYPLHKAIRSEATMSCVLN